MTLFYMADSSIQIFKDVIDKYYKGKFDENTLNILEWKRSLK